MTSSPIVNTQHDRLSDFHQEGPEDTVLKIQILDKGRETYFLSTSGVETALQKPSDS